MAKIEDNLKKMHAAIIAERFVNGHSELGKLLNDAAVAAVTTGLDSDAGKAYMAIFADNPDQLERLTVPKPGEPTYLPLLRAYMVSNAICDPSTNGHTNHRVGPQIDGLAGDPDDPPVNSAESDPGNVILNLRPAGLKSIPTVTLPETTP